MAKVIIEYQEYQELLQLKTIKEEKREEGEAWEVLKAIIEDCIERGNEQGEKNVYLRVQEYINKIITRTGFKIRINSIGELSLLKQ